MAPVAMALTSPEDHRMIEANDAFWQLTGYSPTSFLGRAAGDPELWADVTERNAAEAEIARAGGLRNRDVRLSDADGRPVDCLLWAERMMLHDERCTLWLFQDITARRHSELDLVNAIEAVMKDASWFSRSVMDKLVSLKDPCGTRASAVSTDLTPREREILDLIWSGQGRPIDRASAVIVEEHDP
jgi:PAS domain S-box-containing protein